MIYKPQSEFPLLKEYKAVFDVTEHTIFAYDKVIYSNNTLPQHLEIHERRHLIRQDKMGLDTWVKNYLEDPVFRLKEEVIAYKEQLLSIKDREKRNYLKKMCVKDLCSPLYGSICSKEEAEKLLHV